MGRRDSDTNMMLTQPCSCPKYSYRELICSNNAAYRIAGRHRRKDVVIQWHQNRAGRQRSSISPCPDPPTETIAAPDSPGADSMQASDKMLPQSIVADSRARPRQTPPTVIGPARSRLELTADECRIARNHLFARALGHPCLAALEHCATEQFPHMALVSQKQ